MIVINKQIIWVVGLQSSGKTSLTKFFKDFFKADVLNIGEEIRSRQNVDNFKNEDSAYAPSSVEPFVNATIYNHIDEFYDNDSSLLMIDSAPRNERQFVHVLEANKRNIDNTILFVCDYGKLRCDRAISRNVSYEYFLKRETEEIEWVVQLRNLCQIHKINTIFINGNTINEGLYGKNVNISFQNRL